MGHAKAKLRFSNPRLPDLRPVDVEALADSGASYLCIPTDIALELQPETESTRTIMLANGRSQTYPYVGPIRVAFEDRSCFAGALVLGSSVLLGVIPMEDMDLVIHPQKERVTVNPASPDTASGRA